MLQLQLKHSFDSALPPSCQLSPFVCHCSQFLSAFGVCMLNSFQRKLNEQLCATCTSAFKGHTVLWTHLPGYLLQDPHQCLPNTHLPLKHSWTLKKSRDNVGQFTFCKGPRAVLHWAPTASPLLIFQLTCKLFLPKKTHFIPLPSFYLVYILLPYPLLNSFSSLLFHFFKSFHMLAASPFSQQQIQSSAIWQSKEIGLLVKFASRLARSS